MRTSLRAALVAGAVAVMTLGASGAGAATPGVTLPPGQVKQLTR